MDILNDYCHRYDYGVLFSSLTKVDIVDEVLRLLEKGELQQIFVLSLEHDIEDLAMYLYIYHKCVLPVAVIQKGIKRFIASQEPEPQEVTEIIGVHEGLHVDVSGKGGRVIEQLCSLHKQSRYGRFNGQWGWVRR